MFCASFFVVVVVLAFLLACFLAWFLFFLSFFRSFPVLFVVSVSVGVWSKRQTAPCRRKRVVVCDRGSEFERNKQTAKGKEGKRTQCK